VLVRNLRSVRVVYFGLMFLRVMVPAYPGCPGKEPLNGRCVLGRCDVISSSPMSQRHTVSQTAALIMLALVFNLQWFSKLC